MIWGPIAAALALAVACSNGGPGGSNCGECFAANQCVAECGGAVVYSGCCGCPSGTKNALTCPVDAGRDADLDADLLPSDAQPPDAADASSDAPADAKKD